MFSDHVSEVAATVAQAWHTRWTNRWGCLRRSFGILIVFINGGFVLQRTCGTPLVVSHAPSAVNICSFPYDTRLDVEQASELLCVHNHGECKAKPRCDHAVLMCRGSRMAR